MTEPADEQLPAERIDPPLEGEVEHLDPTEERIAQVVLNAVMQNIQINTSLQLPIEDLERLKQLDEGAFQLYLRRFEAQHDSDIFLAEAPHRLPHHLARTARPWALITIALLCGLAGYLAYLGDTGKALAALFAICVPMALAFLNPGGSSNGDDSQGTPEE